MTFVPNQRVRIRGRYGKTGTVVRLMAAIGLRSYYVVRLDNGLEVAKQADNLSPIKERER